MVEITGRFIQIKFQREGFHSYIDAPTEVDFLRKKHRHLFKVRVKVEVSHNERELEFFMLKTRIEESVDEVELFQNKNMSCEGYAETIATALERSVLSLITQHFVTRRFEVEVSEDGESAAIIEGEIG